jgi:hypothetical protein
MHTNCPALYLIHLPSWVFCTVGIVKILLEGDLRYYPHIFFWHIKTYGDNICFQRTVLGERSFGIVFWNWLQLPHSLYCCVLWWNFSAGTYNETNPCWRKHLDTDFSYSFFLMYRLTCYLIFRPSYFAQNVEFWVSYPDYSFTDSEKWNLCETSRLC